MTKVFISFLVGLWLGLTNLVFHAIYLVVIAGLLGYIAHLKGLF